MVGDEYAEPSFRGEVLRLGNSKFPVDSEPAAFGIISSYDTSSIAQIDTPGPREDLPAIRAAVLYKTS